MAAAAPRLPQAFDELAGSSSRAGWLWVPGPAGSASPLCPTSHTTWRGGVSTLLVEMETLRPKHMEGRRPCEVWQPRGPGGGEEAAPGFLSCSPAAGLSQLGKAGIGMRLRGSGRATEQGHPRPQQLFLLRDGTPWPLCNLPLWTEPLSLHLHNEDNELSCLPPGTIRSWVPPASTFRAWPQEPNTHLLPGAPRTVGRRQSKGRRVRALGGNGGP